MISPFPPVCDDGNDKDDDEAMWKWVSDDKWRCWLLLPQSLLTYITFSNSLEKKNLRENISWYSLEFFIRNCVGFDQYPSNCNHKVSCGDQICFWEMEIMGKLMHDISEGKLFDLIVDKSSMKFILKWCSSSSGRNCPKVISLTPKIIEIGF